MLQMLHQRLSQFDLQKEQTRSRVSALIAPSSPAAPVHHCTVSWGPDPAPVSRSQNIKMNKKKYAPKTPSEFVIHKIIQNSMEGWNGQWSHSPDKFKLMIQVGFLPEL